MKKNLLLIMIPLFMTMVSCNENDDSTIPNDRKDIALSRSEMQMAKENVKFSFSLFKKMNELETKDNNWMVSPLSASVALSMIANGTGGNTFAQLQNVLGFNDYSLVEMKEYYRKVNSGLKALDNTTKLYIANSVWTRKGMDMFDSYVNTGKDVFNAEFSTLDSSSSNALKKINEWCAWQTHNAIPKILDELPDDVMACFLNALYFKGIWKNKFNVSATKDELFYNSEGRSNLVKMMKQTDNFDYYEHEAFAIAEFPYGNGAFSMAILLPNKEETLEKCLEKFTADFWLDEMETSRRELNVLFPRFEMNYERDLIEIMKEMGVTDVFDANKADFSNMSSTAFYLNLLKQALYIKVDEKGTEAAAVTLGSGMVTDNAPTKPIDFHINRPFVFLIKEKSTGNILYMGKITEL